MKSAVLSGLFLAAAVLTFIASLSATSRAEAQAAPGVIYSSTFPIPGALPAPGAPFDLFHLVVEVPPGGRTASHSHPFGCVQTVLQGQATNRIGNNGFVGVAGQKLIFPANSFGTHENDSTTNRAVFLASGFAG